ncbi:isoquinoline 1-oxidoreductase subunit beta [Oceanibaculum indicum P24]|uniref:Isoquinoline 1-oxidoreductase subunit beta n=2 Tax=Oceanibaculum indicum TaxID=526216 RepID=K2JU59_9PROT|nr:isoquinoline 1-oxidoreductase subunit beta [Oceanibaculum indicum P24]
MREDRTMTTTIDVTRRGFMVGTAVAGFSLGFPIPFLSGKANAQAGFPDEINAWVVVRPDEQVIIRIARSEMGQGTLTGLAQLVVEELECDWANVTTEYPTPATNLERGRVWQSFSTGGSRGIRESHDYVRMGGATAREMLIMAAAREWGVAPGECRASKGVITHAASGRSTTFGKVAEAASRLEVPTGVQLKDPKDWTVIGQPLKRLDTAEKVTGKQVYGADLKLPGMLNAAIRQCPVFGGTLDSFDESAVLSMPGVKKVVAVDGNAVAVVADRWWQAKSALDALPITWNEGANAKVTSASIDDFVKEGLTADQAFVGNSNGDAEAALARAERTVEAVYSYPFQNHATMEPMNATAVWTEDRCEVWCPTQNGEAALAATSEAAGLPLQQCDVHKLHLGGGFGRRGAFHDYVRQAVLIAREFPGTPVKLLWSREEDMTHGMYHPITQCKLTAGLDANGDVTAFRVRISGQSILAGVMPQRLSNGADMITFQCYLPQGDHAISYSFPNLLVDHAMRNPHVPPGFWRGVNANQNSVYTECFIDEVAHAAGKDPLEFRLKLMDRHPKNAAVLRAVAERAGWGSPAPEGVFRGLAQCTAFGSHIAACAEVSVTNGQLKIHRIVAATDCGHVVNPQQVEAQVEGSFAYGLSAMLYGECTVADGRIEQQNFDSYQIMRIAEMPEVETIIMPSGGFWGGVGEPTIAVAAPAVLNAIFAATGKRIRELPLSKHDLGSA